MRERAANANGRDGREPARALVRGLRERAGATPDLARARTLTARALAACALLGVCAAVGAGAAGMGATAAVCALALCAAAAAAGWLLGARARIDLEEDVERRTRDLKRALSELEIAQAETVQRLSMAVEFRDEDTGAHIERIGRFSVLLAEHIGMDEEFCERLKHAAPLHDVGKVAIPDAILMKPGPLTPEERAIIETHAEEGHRLVRGSSSAILDMAATIALSHQEKWDGSGYPRGLKGEAIPIEGRIVAVVDVFDALTSDRVYRKAFSVEDAVQMMREQRGRHFDPVLLDAFMEVLGQSGPDARARLCADPGALVEQTLETFALALQRGDAETAEGAIAVAIEEGITPTVLHAEVIGPTLRRLRRRAQDGEIDADRERLAHTIIKRVLATLRRYMTGATEPTRARVLLASLDGDSNTLGLQMVHDQLAAAGFRTSLRACVTLDGLGAEVDRESPEVLVMGTVSDGVEDAVERALRDIRAAHPHLRVVLAGPAVGGALPRELDGLAVLERVDESVGAVEELLTAAAAV